MERDVRIRDALNRVIEVFKKRPQKALSTNHARAVVEDGLRCVFTQGEHSAVMDMPEIMGGQDAGPTPGFYARAGIAGCVSMGIKEGAILAQVDFEKVTVDIETDFDDGASLGLGTASAAPLETRLTVKIETAAPPAQVSAIVNEVLERDPWFLALRDRQVVKVEVRSGG
jgi:uncharacterized OsmC-like protein